MEIRENIYYQIKCIFSYRRCIFLNEKTQYNCKNILKLFVQHNIHIIKITHAKRTSSKFSPKLMNDSGVFLQKIILTAKILNCQNI